ncbi:T9SS type A sorting domain-containing protein [Maribellus comscasis]|uniref:T9SS type A sorting domain-containing protein n=1 Tax=Maribellus comscasis TaxID=2681766 RepID=A0A6I6JX55_9BACT|nr:discoidin domain-containing protein [Maribellus comscasis]QGY45688.1 T9SS type A sorting domain-containing protein [Maribellus comscasis]
MKSLFSFFRSYFFFGFFLANLIPTTVLANDINSTKPFYIDENASYYVNTETWNNLPQGGDTIFISANRTHALKFQYLSGSAENPLVIINSGGQVNIDSETAWGALTFENCQYIKVSGAGHPGYKYGFLLSAKSCGLAFSELSSDCEAEFVKISHDGFFGIYAKKDYGGNPPSPVPVFSDLVIHDCFIENVTEGMYLGETKSPGMEFKHVKIYNNIVRNTGREAIQIANMVEDIEIYNNTLLSTGNDSTLYQENILQIGDNSAANVYNNILIGAPSYGIISLGNGNNTYTNNYIADSKGMYIDNRLFTDSTAAIEVSGNYFSQTHDGEVIENRNEINFISITNNQYDTHITFFNNNSGNDTNFVDSDNSLETIEEIAFTDIANNDYSLSANSLAIYGNIGAPGGPEYSEYDEGTTTEDTVPVSEQIRLSSSMITDLVEGGSVYSADYLVDEQDSSVENNEHPTSQSWKPYWNMNNAPYSVYIDLGKVYNITEIALHDMNNVANLEVYYGEPDNWQALFTESCNKYKTWKTHETDVATRYIKLTMSESVYAAVNEIIIYGYEVVVENTLVSEQIQLSGSMIYDLVDGGSVYSADFLVDEQNIVIENDEHPTSQSWKPYWNMNNAPYSVYLDLGRVYNITEIALHDMNNVANLEISYGEPGNWQALFTESCNKYKTWKIHETDIATRYIRLTMSESVYAAVNEIILYGYAEESEDSSFMEEKSVQSESYSVTTSSATIEESISDKNLVLYPNPAQNKLTVDIPQDWAFNYKIEIINMQGIIYYTRDYNELHFGNPTINLEEYNMNKGIYFMRFTNDQGIAKTVKFIKNT